MSHWNARDNWLGCQSSNPEKCEFWDGERWTELQWFWDPNSTWTLPALCHHCGLPVSYDQLINSSNGIDGSKDVEYQNGFVQYTVEVENLISTTDCNTFNHWQKTFVDDNI